MDLQKESFPKSEIIEKEKKGKESIDELLSSVYKRLSELEIKLEETQEIAYKLDDELGTARFKLLTQKQ